MSALAATGLVVLVVLAGLAWWERSQPDARLLALVATLAALAVVGRIAFAPIPNVKPTTDIVLLTGFALGGAPGFAVGAIAALASNVVFGQGPWTPWQMAAWGLCGLFGALLARSSHGRLGRVPLAACCGLAGLGFGAILDLSTWMTFAGAKTLPSYLAYSATSLSFNVAHAVGNAVFCLLFGPALVTAIGRYRRRLDATWLPLAPRPGTGSALGLLLALVVAGGALAAAPVDARADASSRAVAFLRATENADGGFGGDRGQASSPLYTAWAAMGLVAAGRPCGAPLAASLRRAAGAVTETGDVERTLLALRSCGTSSGRLTRRLLAARDADGSWDRLTNLTSFAVLALRADGLGPSSRAVARGGAWIARQQNADGGFSFATRGSASGIDDSAAALQALIASGRGRGAPVSRAVRFLLARQHADGGWGLSPTAPSNAQSTSWAIQALVAARRDPARVRRGSGRTATAYLASLSGPDGAVRYSRTSRQTPVWVTAQALTAFARRPFPVLPGGSITRLAPAQAAAVSRAVPAAAASAAGDTEAPAAAPRAPSAAPRKRTGAHRPRSTSRRRTDKRRAGDPVASGAQAPGQLARRAGRLVAALLA